ncbi:MAG TPA: hypothetical protein VIH34_04005, partial [Candidatus Bathyarchaeia archaeon]
MTLLDPIVPMLGPLGPALAASDRLVVILGFIGLASLGLYFVKKNIFETSKGWVGATVALSIVTLLFRGMGSLCSCDWFTDSAGAPTQLVPFTYLLIAGSFFAILYNFNIP